MPQDHQLGQIVRFGSFEVDLQEARLTRSGIRIRLQGQPFQILALLLERAGQVVTREEIRERLWSQETFVEFDDALNTAVRKLRAALGDSADNPRFLETVPRRGYRFVAPVHIPEARAERESLVPVPQSMPAFVADGTEAIAAPADIAAARRSWFRAGAWISVAVLAAVAVGIYWRSRHHIFKLTAKDTVVIADFVNTTGEPVFDDALRQGLEISLAESPTIKVLADRKAALILKQMAHTAEDRMTGKIAVEVCQRASGKVTVQGQISSLGTAYLVGLAAIRCDNGEPIANEQVQARRKEDVVDALGEASAKLRSRLGESLPSIEKYNAPLEQATTASLDALNAYGLALSTWDKQGDRASLPIFAKATTLDPNFAQAYGALATIYHNLGKTDLARENASKAYSLRSQVTQAERSNIEARYFSYVTGELDKAQETRALEAKDYPDSAGALNHLGNVDGELARYEQSTEDLRKALQLDPTRANTYSNLGYDLIALGRIDEASGLVAEANRRKLQSDGLLEDVYWITFLKGDRVKLLALVENASNDPAAKPILLQEQSNTEAYYGHYEQSSEMSRRAADEWEQGGDKESAASALAQAAVRDVLVDEKARAREFLAQAGKLSQSEDVQKLTALTLAQLGDARDAEALMRPLNDAWPVGTYVQRYWLPIIRAENHLRKNMAAPALEDLAAVPTPFELATVPPWLVATLWPDYERGRAYLAMHDCVHAQAQFQKIIDHRNLSINYPLGSLAYLWLARSYSCEKNVDEARRTYLAFFKYWNSADAENPLFIEARRELEATERAASSPAHKAGQ